MTPQRFRLFTIDSLGAPFGLKNIQSDPQTVGAYIPQIWGGTDQLVRRNLLGYTEDFSKWAKQSATVTADTVTATATSGSCVFQPATIRSASAIVSVELKAGTATTVRLGFYNNTTSSNVGFPDGFRTISSGVDVGSGWYKHSITVSSGFVPMNQVAFYLYPNNSSGQTVGDSIYARKYCVIQGDTLDQSYQKITDWTTEVFQYNAQRQLLWLRRNRFVSTATLATQTVSSVTASQLTVSFTGTGTITFSGAYSGSLVGTGASDRVQTTFTPSAGNLTCTVTGSVTNAQCENAAAATAYQDIGASWPATYTSLAQAAGYPISLYSDRAGTIAVDSPETVVGKMLDFSTKGNHLVAPTDAARPLLKRDGNGNYYLLRDLVDDSLNVTLPNYGASCVTYQQDAATCNKATGVTLNGATSFSTPAVDYARVLLQGASNNDAKIQKYLNKLAGL